jgi:PAS domain S-box-containing protein
MRDDTERAPECKVNGMQFAANDHPMWVVDHESHAFLDVNNVAVQLYGYSRKEFLSMRTLDLSPVADIPELIRQRRDPKRSKDPNTAEQGRHQGKNGIVFPVALTSWGVMFHGRHAELVLARPNSDDLDALGSVLARSMQH